MLDTLRKKLTGEKTEDNPQASTETEASGVVHFAAMQEAQTQMSDLFAQIEQLNSLVAEKDAALSAQASVMSELNDKLSQHAELIKEAEAKAAAMAEEAKMKEVAERRTKLAEVIGADNPGFEETFAAIGELPQVSFNTVVDGFAKSFAREAESPMFKEVGVEGEASAPDENATMRIIKKTYLEKE